VEARDGRQPLHPRVGRCRLAVPRPPAIEPYASELVGAERGIVLGKKSGLDSIRIKVEELGLDVPEERFPALLESVKKAGTRKRGLVSDADFRRLVRRGG
jgi:isopropylmalate/homocitrate/citramalate synthase